MELWSAAACVSLLYSTIQAGEKEASVKPPLSETASLLLQKLCCCLICSSLRETLCPFVAPSYPAALSYSAVRKKPTALLVGLFPWVIMCENGPKGEKL